MKGLETGKDKVKKICEILRDETLEPAKREAEELLDRAKAEAEIIIGEARLLAQQIQEDAGKEIERQKNVFQSSLNQACKQALESLKQKIEEKLFNQQLSELLLKTTHDPKVMADLITAVIHALEKEGLDADLSVYIPAAVPAKTVNALLAQNILDKLKEKSVLLSSIGGGIEVKLHKNNITIDLSDTALKEIVANYIRKDFREMIFDMGM